MPGVGGGGGGGNFKSIKAMTTKLSRQIARRKLFPLMSANEELCHHF